MILLKKYKLQLALVASLLLPAALFSSQAYPNFQDSALDGNNCNITNDCVDSSAHKIACKDITVVVNGSRSATVSPEQIADFLVEDHDSISLSILEPRTSFRCVDAGEHLLTLKASTPSGQQSRCQAIVSVEDNTPAPTAVCKDITVQLDLMGTARIYPSDIDSGNTYPCGYSNLSLDRLSFSSADIGKENIVTLKAIGKEGKVSSCQAMVTVVDRLPPSLTCPQNVIVHVNDKVSGTHVTLAKPLVVDNCGITDLQYRYRPLDSQYLPSSSWSNYEVDPSGFFAPGAYEIQWLATDRSGNQTHCSTRLSLSTLTQ